MNCLKFFVASSFKNESKLCSLGTGYSGRKYSLVSMETLHLFAISFVLDRTSSNSPNNSYISYISSEDLKYCSEENIFSLLGSSSVLPVLIHTFVS